MSPTMRVLRVMLAFASVFVPCACGATLDLRREGPRVECGRCAKPIRGRA
jgi:hypothetical protein